MRLHLIVVAIRRRVGPFDPHGAVSDSLVGVAHRRCDRPQELRRIDGLVGHLAVEYDRLLSRIFGTDQCPGMHRVIARRCDHQKTSAFGDLFDDLPESDSGHSVAEAVLVRYLGDGQEG